jgi:hypothetical protein
VNAGAATGSTWSARSAPARGRTTLRPVRPGVGSAGRDGFGSGPRDRRLVAVRLRACPRGAAEGIWAPDRPVQNRGLRVDLVPATARQGHPDLGRGGRLARIKASSRSEPHSAKTVLRRPSEDGCLNASLYPARSVYFGHSPFGCLAMAL